LTKRAIESADESGFDLEHVDDIRYGIRSKIWENEALPAPQAGLQAPRAPPPDQRTHAFPRIPQGDIIL
jgi:hypothetical protein